MRKNVIFDKRMPISMAILTSQPDNGLAWLSTASKNPYSSSCDRRRLRPTPEEDAQSKWDCR